MNVSVVGGILLAIAVFFIGTLTATSQWRIFLDGHAALIVLGGTLAAALISFPISQLWKMTKVVALKVLRLRPPVHMQVIAEVVKLADGHKNDPNYLQENVQNIETPFLREAVSLHVEGGIDDAKIDGILEKRADVHLVRYEDEAHFFKTLARFPPAFGLLGAVLGIVALLAGLGSPDSFQTIGPAMALAMVATLYGIALANLFFVPLGENLSKLSKEDHIMRQIVIDAIKLLRDQEHPIVVEEYLKSYLLSSERSQLSRFMGKQSPESEQSAEVA